MDSWPAIQAFLASQHVPGRVVAFIKERFDRLAEGGERTADSCIGMVLGDSDLVRKFRLEQRERRSRLA